MRTPLRILIADDNPANLDIFERRLASRGYEITTVGDGEQALNVAREQRPDLILLDLMMPKMNGIDVCRRLKGDPTLPFMPIVIVTAKADAKDVVAGLEAGADDYLTKPVEPAALVARVKSMLRIKSLHDESQEQTRQLKEQSAELAEINQTLERRVAEQLADLERVGRLKRYLSPHVAEMIISTGEGSILESHRREITVVSCDLRGFTAFAETTEPEEVMQVLSDFHGAVGPLITSFEATLEHFAGDGIMVYFNDPLPCADPVARAVRLAVAMRGRVDELSAAWRKLGHDLGFGVGIASGFATLGELGFEGQFHYGAIGTVLNLASRLCDEATTGQILISRRVFSEIEDVAEVAEVGQLSLKGFHKSVPAYNVIGLKET